MSDAEFDAHEGESTSDSFRCGQCHSWKYPRGEKRDGDICQACLPSRGTSQEAAQPVQSNAEYDAAALARPISNDGWTERFAVACARDADELARKCNDLRAQLAEAAGLLKRHRAIHPVVGTLNEEEEAFLARIDGGKQT